MTEPMSTNEANTQWIWSTGRAYLESRGMKPERARAIIGKWFSSLSANRT